MVKSLINDTLRLENTWLYFLYNNRNYYTYIGYRYYITMWNTEM